MKHLMLILTLLVCSQYAPAHAADGILPIERQIVTSPVECGAAWDGEGALIYSECGNSAYTVILPISIKRQLVGKGMFTHNHPDGLCWTFSPDDLGFAAVRYLPEMRVVAHRQGVVTVSILRNAARAMYMPADAIENEARSQKEAMHDDPTGCDYMATTWTALATRYGFEYMVLHD